MPRQCIHPGCETRSAYGKAGTKNAKYCNAHKEAGYVDVVSKRCMHPGCEKIPAYGKPGSKDAKYCAPHKQAGDVDLKSKR